MAKAGLIGKIWRASAYALFALLALAAPLDQAHATVGGAPTTVADCPANFVRLLGSSPPSCQSLVGSDGAYSYGACPTGTTAQTGRANQIIRRGWIISQGLDQTGTFSYVNYGVDTSLPNRATGRETPQGLWMPINNATVCCRPDEVMYPDPAQNYQMTCRNAGTNEVRTAAIPCPYGTMLNSPTTNLDDWDGNAVCWGIPIIPVQEGPSPRCPNGCYSTSANHSSADFFETVDGTRGTYPTEGYNCYERYTDADAVEGGALEPGGLNDSVYDVGDINYGATCGATACPSGMVFDADAQTCYGTTTENIGPGYPTANSATPGGFAGSVSITPGAGIACPPGGLDPCPSTAPDRPGISIRGGDIRIGNVDAAGNPAGDWFGPSSKENVRNIVNDMFEQTCDPQDVLNEFDAQFKARTASISAFITDANQMRDHLLQQAHNETKGIIDTLWCDFEFDGALLALFDLASSIGNIAAAILTGLMAVLRQMIATIMDAVCQLIANVVTGLLSMICLPGLPGIALDMPSLNINLPDFGNCPNDRMPLLEVTAAPIRAPAGPSMLTILPDMNYTGRTRVIH